jgi:hypothetical protein
MAQPPVGYVGVSVLDHILASQQSQYLGLRQAGSFAHRTPSKQKALLMPGFSVMGDTGLELTSRPALTHKPPDSLRSGALRCARIRSDRSEDVPTG